MKIKVAILLFAFVFCAEASRITEKPEQQKSDNVSSQVHYFEQQDNPVPGNAGRAPRNVVQPSRFVCNPYLEAAWHLIKSVLPKKD
jgi:hypothetical protein